MARAKRAGAGASQEADDVATGARTAAVPEAIDAVRSVGRRECVVAFGVWHTAMPYRLVCFLGRLLDFSAAIPKVESLQSLFARRSALTWAFPSD